MEIMDFSSPNYKILGKGVLSGLNPPKILHMNADKMGLELFIFSLPIIEFSCLLKRPQKNPISL